MKTVYGGVEEDFAHSRATWHATMKGRAQANNFQVLGESKWLLADTNFSTQVREMKKANADIIAISAHPFSLCGALKEMQRQGVKPKLLVGLTSSSSLETLQGCAKQAEGIIIPTSFAPVTKEGKAASEATAKFKGNADLHSMAAWENMFILKQVIEAEKISGNKKDVQADRRKIRDGLAKLKTTQGLMGVTKRTDDREADKPYLFVHAKGGQWVVLHNPL
jgi:branched-chain amino acid transport system substrate-binding protein